MKKILLIFFLLLINPGFSLTEVIKKNSKRHPDDVLSKTFYYKDGQKVAEETLDEKGHIIKAIGRIPDDVVRQYYDNGKLYLELNYSKGKRNGLYKIYYENSSLFEEGNYKDGNLEGMVKFYFGDGSYLESNYKNGKKEGTERRYGKNGTLELESNYKNDKKEGAERSFRENGTLFEEANYKDDIREGISKLFREDGKTIGSEFYYKNGKIVGLNGKNINFLNLHANQFYQLTVCILFGLFFLYTLWHKPKTNNFESDLKHNNVKGWMKVLAVYFVFQILYTFSQMAPFFIFSTQMDKTKYIYVFLLFLAACFYTYTIFSLLTAKSYVVKLAKISVLLFTFLPILTLSTIFNIGGIRKVFDQLENIILPVSVYLYLSFSKRVKEI